jgi:prepilin-type N-terminal cleavage/methylation domain-containing protein
MVILMKDEKGFTLIEVVIAIAVMGIIAAAYLGALGNSSMTLAVADERATAESLARSQMEYVKEQDYSDNYTAPIIPTEYDTAGYSATITPPELVKAGLQRIKITVYHNGKAIITSSSGCTLVGYKGDH